MTCPARRGLPAILACAMAISASSRAGFGAERPKLTLKGSPATGTSSTLFLFRAELKGGEDSEELYCLTAEWIWEEQADSSLNETECPPYVAGQTRIERSFTEEQSFRRPGPHLVKLILRKGEKEIASAATTVRVRPTP